MVTRLDGPSTIKLGGNGGCWSAVPDSQIGAPAMAKKAAAAAAGKPVPHTRAGAKKSRHDRLNYAKWDHLDDDDDDDEQEEAEMESRLEEAGDHDDDRDELSPEELQKAQTLLKKLQDDEEKEKKSGASSSSSAAPPPPQLPPAMDKFVALRAKLTRNGALCAPTHLWRQTETEVELSILLPPNTKAKDLYPPQLVPPQEKFIQKPDGTIITASPSTMDASKQMIVVRGRFLGAGGVASSLGGATPPFFSKSLAYPVEAVETEEDLQWEVSDYESKADGGRRVLRISFKKTVPEGVVVWWDRAFVDDPKCDTMAFPDRKRAGNIKENAEIWEEANRAFKERVMSRGKIPIDAGGEEDDEESDEDEDEDVEMEPAPVS